MSSPVTPVNNVGLEEYLLGVVPRESPAWFATEALKAQAVAARSYTLSTLKPASSPYDICDSESCQVYAGIRSHTASGAVTELQSASTTAAVRATAGEIREYQGAAAFTQFSSSNGGWSATGSKPYLAAREDPWSSPAGKVPQDTVARWTAQLPVATVAANCPNGGALRSMTVTRRTGDGVWGGRVLELVLRCSTGDKTLAGTSVARFGSTLKSSWWTVVPGGSADITAYWRAAGGDASVLGRPTSDVFALPQVEGSYQNFERGAVYWSPRSGVHAVRGAIRDAWGRLGWENSALAFPSTDERPLALRGGAFQQFLGGSLYWSPATGAHEVRGAIRDRWGALGWETGYLGYPTSDERRLAAGAYATFEGGSVYWSRATGAHAVRGAIRDAWGRTGWEDGVLGYPVTDELKLSGGAFTAFAGGSVYWSPATGAHVVRGAIRDAWGAQGWETGRLGYPTSDERAVAGGRRSDFQGGSITWTQSGGAVVTYS
nr:SpoIID/LytB domain-containing protein [Kineococcus aurantiacus]